MSRHHKKSLSTSCTWFEEFLGEKSILTKICFHYQLRRYESNIFFNLLIKQVHMNIFIMYTRRHRVSSDMKKRKRKHYDNRKMQLDYKTVRIFLSGSPMFWHLRLWRNDHRRQILLLMMSKVHGRMMMLSMAKVCPRIERNVLQ